MLLLDRMKLQDCDIFVSKWLKTDDSVHLDHFALLLSELGVGGLLTTLGSVLEASDRKKLITTLREGDLFRVNDVITGALGSDYIIYRSGTGPWQIIND